MSYFKATFHVSLDEEIHMLKQMHVCEWQHKIHPIGWGPGYCSEFCKQHYDLLKRLENVQVTINVS